MNEKMEWEEAIDISGRVFVFDEVESTQDAAVSHNLSTGDVCAALIQTAGRGRNGSSWDSSGGVAVTVVLDSISPHFSIAVAATLASQLNNLVPTCKIGIKWPNDLFIHGRKLAGILIEHREGQYLVGIGVNVVGIPTGEHAECLGNFGCDDRSVVVRSVVASVFEAANLTEGLAVSAWKQRDILVGTSQRLCVAGKEIDGMVVDIDPLNNLLLQTNEGILALPAATSRVITPCNTKT